MKLRLSELETENSKGGKVVYVDGEFASVNVLGRVSKVLRVNGKELFENQLGVYSEVVGNFNSGKAFLRYWVVSK